MMQDYTQQLKKLQTICGLQINCFADDKLKISENVSLA